MGRRDEAVMHGQIPLLYVRQQGWALVGTYKQHSFKILWRCTIVQRETNRGTTCMSYSVMYINRGDFSPNNSSLFSLDYH